ncbi:hypothetical protein TKK_0004179 [Trichogramma kaykai]
MSNLLKVLQNLEISEPSLGEVILSDECIIIYGNECNGVIKDDAVDLLLWTTGFHSGVCILPELISSVDSPNFSNQLAEESSPASGRMQSDDTSMSDSNSNGTQQVKTMEAETIPSSQENTCDADIR